MKTWYDVLFDADYNQDPRNLGARKFATIGMVSDWFASIYADRFISEQEAETSERDNYFLSH